MVIGPRLSGQRPIREEKPKAEPPKAEMKSMEMGVFDQGAGGAAFNWKFSS